MFSMLSFVTGAQKLSKLPVTLPAIEELCPYPRKLGSSCLEKLKYGPEANSLGLRESGTETESKLAWTIRDQ